MKKLFVMLIIFLAINLFAQVVYNNDGTVSLNSSLKKEGHLKKHSMDGFTPYGVKIKDLRDFVKRKKFVIELIYAGKYSDDLLNKYSKFFFKQLLSESGRWLNKNSLVRGRIKLIISCCRFSETGYCKRTGIKAITIYAFFGDKIISRYKIDYADIFNKKKIKMDAKTAINGLLNFKKIKKLLKKK